MIFVLVKFFKLIINEFGIFLESVVVGGVNEEGDLDDVSIWVFFIFILIKI